MPGYAVSMPPVISIVGKKKSGKTTLIEMLLPALAQRGVRAGTLKHDTHGFDMDRPGKDTHRHFAAGAAATLIASSEKIGMQKRLDHPLSLEELVSLYLADMDLVLTEGYKSEDKPKIETFLPQAHRSLLCGSEDDMIAVVSDVDIPAPAPVLPWDRTEDLIDLILKKLRFSAF